MTDWPSSRELGDPPGVFGREITTDSSRIGHVDDGNLAWPERVVEARRQWAEASSEDFERAGRRRWRDRASGVVYRQATGAPLLSDRDATRNVVCFFVSGGQLIFLERMDVAQGLTTYHGQIRGGVVEDGRIRWSES